MPTYAAYNKINPSSVVTPVVTGIDYPSNEDGSTDLLLDSYHHRPTPPTAAAAAAGKFYTHPNIAGSAIEDGAASSVAASSAIIRPPADARSLDLLWGTIRQEKEKKMAKERSKVQSLEKEKKEMPVLQHHLHHHHEVLPVFDSQMPVHLDSPPMSNLNRTPRRHKSISDFRESTDGRSIVATFELPEVAKEDIHVSFQRNKLVLTWEMGELREWQEDGVEFRELIRSVHHRTLPLPEGTRFQEIRAQMTNRGLVLRYPNMRCYRVDGQSHSAES